VSASAMGRSVVVDMILPPKSCTEYMYWNLNQLFLDREVSPDQRVVKLALGLRYLYPDYLANQVSTVVGPAARLGS